LLGLPHLLGNSLGHIYEFTFFVEFKQLFVAVVSEARLNQILEDHLDLVHFLLGDHRIYFMPHISDVLGCGRQPMPPSQVLQVNRRAGSESLLVLAAIIQILEKSLVIGDWIKFGNELMYLYFRATLD